MDQYKSAGHVVEALRPDYPVTVLRPHAATRAARWFMDRFPGRVFYAVKANPTPEIIQALRDGGITHFDVASLVEIAMVHDLFPNATLAFMHPVKSARAIERAYFDYGVRIFSLDSQSELKKIVEATRNAPDLTLCVRLSVLNSFAKMSLGAKFGVSKRNASALLLETRQKAQRLGLCFHVGSQTMNPNAYRGAMETVRKVVASAGVTVDILDVGGGFPSRYPGMEPPLLDSYITEVSSAFETLPVTDTCELWCEPGRALVAEASSLIVKVEARKNETLYINDGTYGSLFDAGVPRWTYPTQLLRAQPSMADTNGFAFYGPTCDDMDFMPGPFVIPRDVTVGDYLEIGMLGAYGSTMRTNFNGFHQGITVLAEDGPMLSAYDDSNISNPIISKTGDLR